MNHKSTLTLLLQNKMLYLHSFASRWHTDKAGIRMCKKCQLQHVGGTRDLQNIHLRAVASKNFGAR